MRLVGVILLTLLTSTLQGQLVHDVVPYEDMPEALPKGDKPLRVDVSPVEPMIMHNDESALTGFDYDLVNEIFRRFRKVWVGEVDFTHIEWSEVPFEDILDGVQGGTADLAVAGITINRIREEQVDFTHPYMDSGASIVVRKEESQSLLTMAMAILESKWRALSMLVAFIILCGHIIWWTDKGHDAIDDKYFPGIFEAFWFTLVTMTTVGYGDFAPKKWLTRVTTVFVMLSGIAIFGIIIGELSSFSIEQKLMTSIESPHDLKGKLVAVSRGTNSEEILKKYGVTNLLKCSSTEVAFLNLRADEVDAVVCDTTTARYYVKQYPTLMIAGKKFAPQLYGIALAEDSPLRDKVNDCIHSMNEDGTYEKLYNKWFSGEGQ